MKVRLYKDKQGNLQAESLHESKQAPDDYVFKVVLPIGNAMAECYFTDMTDVEAQVYALRDIDKVMLALANEGSRIGLKDEKEEYYMLQFTLHPSYDKDRERIANKLSEAIEKSGGWMNHIVLPVAPRTYRFDLATSDAEATRQAIATVLGKYAGVKEFVYQVNDI